jgi:uncharacterized RDD family membrane protein YckC
MRWTDELSIATPEQIDVDLELAGLGSRFVAQMLDWLIKISVTGLIALLAAIVVAALGYWTDLETAPKMVMAVVLAAVYFLWMSYDIVCEVAYSGQTWGKWSAGIRVLKDGGAPVDFRTSCIRNLLAIADFLPAFFIFGALLIQMTPRRQRLGDLAAGTIVVRERIFAAPTETAPMIESLARQNLAFTAEQLRRCSAGDRNILRSFLQRADVMARDEWSRLAQRLAVQFAERTLAESPVATPDDAAAFLASLYRDLTAFHRLSP